MRNNIRLFLIPQEYYCDRSINVVIVNSFCYNYRSYNTRLNKHFYVKENREDLKLNQISHTKPLGKSKIKYTPFR